MRILYIGSRGALSSIPLRALLESGRNVVAVALDAGHRTVQRHPAFPLLTANDESVESIARLNDVPLVSLAEDLSTCVGELNGYAADIILVSCFARKLPDCILSIPRIGCFNLHPSLLPAYRGPVPLFWQFRDGVGEFGVCLHRMSSRIDAGNIVAQTRVRMPAGVDARQAAVLLAGAGSSLIASALDDFASGHYRDYVQDECRASYQGVPSASDFVVDTGWSAKRMYNFIRASRDFGVPCPCDIGGRVYRLVQADSWQEEGSGGFSIAGDEITIPCRRGIVRARFVED